MNLKARREIDQRKRLQLKFACGLVKLFEKQNGEEVHTLMIASSPYRSIERFVVALAQLVRALDW